MIFEVMAIWKSHTDRCLVCGKVALGLSQHREHGEGLGADRVSESASLQCATCSLHVV